MSFTNKAGSLENRVYERLRKRSWRSIDRRTLSEVCGSDWPTSVDYDYFHHMAYVAGLRQGIKELVNQ